MTDKKYNENRPTEIIRIMSSGKSTVQAAAEMGISKDSLYSWAKDPNKPEFMEAYRIARTCYEAYHEDVLQKIAKGVIKGQAAAQIYMMKCRFRDDKFGDSWKDSIDQKIELKNELKSLSNEEIDETIKTLLTQRNMNKNNGSSGATASP
jgi:hypothetical protein